MEQVRYFCSYNGLCGRSHVDEPRVLVRIDQVINDSYDVTAMISMPQLLLPHCLAVSVQYHLVMEDA
jgi:hypothetical protein